MEKVDTEGWDGFKLGEDDAGVDREMTSSSMVLLASLPA